MALINSSLYHGERLTQACHSDKAPVAAPSTPGFPCQGTHFTKPIKLAKDPEHQRQYPSPILLYFMKNRRTESESDCAISLWTRLLQEEPV